ncbi:hypothetical protein [Wocania ichthyoenteri]|uniref:hypothetical protein n=1 Tax=Wocania ichthyoenteri TaxID=1230531 RepID=UPI00053EFF00|nr:hypothetical protein [Wocania ichthyoenteri]
MDSITFFKGKGKDLFNHAVFSLKYNREIIFIKSLQDLVDLRGINEPHCLVRKGSILRFLLLTDGGYYNIINKEYHQKIKFKFDSKLNETKKTNLVNDKSFVFSITNLNFNKATTGIPIDSFLKQVVMSNADKSYDEFLNLAHIEKEYTVKKIIDLIANGHGGVHIEKSWSKKLNISDVFSDETSPLNISFNSKLHNIVDDISLICIEAMLPICEKIVSQQEKKVDLVFKAQVSLPNTK